HMSVRACVCVCVCVCVQEAGGLRAAPGAVVLTVAYFGAHQQQRRVAGEVHGREVGEAAVLALALRWEPGVAAEHSCTRTTHTHTHTHLPLLYIIPVSS